MDSVHSHIRPNTFLFLRLPNELLKLVEIKLNTIIEVGKLGSFPSNLLIGRPYYHTYELLEKRDGEQYSRLRIVSPSELHAEAGIEDVATPAESRGEPETPSGANGIPESYDLLADDGTVIMKNNRLTIDDGNRQQLSQAEIEELKKSAGSKEVIEKILAGHSGLDEKTKFAKAKYMLRKHKKYLKRFSALPVDIGTVIEYVTEKEAPRIMEMREETLGLITAWSNAHFYCDFDHLEIERDIDTDMEDEPKTGFGRMLVVDDTGGLVVAAIAERMDLLHGPLPQEQIPSAVDSTNGALPAEDVDGTVSMVSEQSQPKTNGDARPAASHRDFALPAKTNTITLIHPAVQPNVSLLKYFGYDTSNPHLPKIEEEHPLHTHLKPLSWLQLLHPEEDPTYVEPEVVSEETLASWKSGKRGNYFKKRRRWERCKTIVDDAREGGFDGIVIASHMDPVTILEHTVPLIRGGGHVVIYSPTIEPLTRVMDLYSKERRTAYIAHLSKDETPSAEDFPLDPRLLLGASLQTSRIREWQVLPGRTHPLMTSRGGPEGFVFTARKVIPLEGGVEARGNFSGQKKRKIASNTDVSAGEVDALLDTTSDAMQQ